MSNSQSLRDKQYQFYGSDRVFYSGLNVGSTTAWSFYGFSGTNTGMGTAGNEVCNKFAIVSSGTSFVEWSYNSGTTLAGEIYNGQAVTMDGVNVSGIWLRSNIASQKVQVWSW